MTGLLTVVKKELKCFGGDRGQNITYVLIPAMWGFALGARDLGEIPQAVPLMFFFFAVIVSTGFSGTVFISERVTGTLEALITSGVSRDAVLFGKMIFVVAMSMAVGLLGAIFMFIWGAATGGIEKVFKMTAMSLALGDGADYALTVYFNAAVSACLSVRMGNPRFLNIINLLLSTGFLALHIGIWHALGLIQPPLAFSIELLALGAAFTFLARREFAGERITRPVIF